LDKKNHLKRWVLSRQCI